MSYYGIYHTTSFSHKIMLCAKNITDDLIDTVIDGGYLPFFLLRRGIRAQLRQRIDLIKATSLSQAYDTKMEYVDLLRSRPIAIETASANEQHYEIGRAHI